IQSLYNKLRQYGSGAVRDLIPTGMMPWVKDASVEPRTASFLDSVWRSYAGFSGLELSNMTHQNDTPWDVAWHHQGGINKYFAPISDDLIEAHYRQKIAEARMHG